MPQIPTPKNSAGALARRDARGAGHGAFQHAIAVAVAMIDRTQVVVCLTWRADGGMYVIHALTSPGVADLATVTRRCRRVADHRAFRYALPAAVAVVHRAEVAITLARGFRRGIRNVEARSRF